MKKSTTREKITSQKNLNHSSRRESRAVSTKAGQLQSNSFLRPMLNCIPFHPVWRFLVSALIVGLGFVGPATAQDLDLYVTFGGDKPTRTNYDNSATVPGTPEKLHLKRPSAIAELKALVYLQSIQSGAPYLLLVREVPESGIEDASERQTKYRGKLGPARSPRGKEVINHDLWMEAENLEEVILELRTGESSPPPVPMGLEAEPETESVTLRWDYPPEEVDKVRILEGESEDPADMDKLKTVDALTKQEGQLGKRRFTHDQAEPGRHCYRLVGIGRYGQKSDPSSVACAHLKEEDDPSDEGDEEFDWWILPDPESPEDSQDPEDPYDKEERSQKSITISALVPTQIHQEGDQWAPTDAKTFECNNFGIIDDCPWALVPRKGQSWSPTDENFFEEVADEVAGMFVETDEKPDWLGDYDPKEQATYHRLTGRLLIRATDSVEYFDFPRNVDVTFGSTADVIRTDINFDSPGLWPYVPEGSHKFSIVVEQNEGAQGLVATKDSNAVPMKLHELRVEVTFGPESSFYGSVAPPESEGPVTEIMKTEARYGYPIGPRQRLIRSLYGGYEQLTQAAKLYLIMASGAAAGVAGGAIGTLKFVGGTVSSKIAEKGLEIVSKRTGQGWLGKFPIMLKIEKDVPFVKPDIQKYINPFEVSKVVGGALQKHFHSKNIYENPLDISYEERKKITSIKRSVLYVSMEAVRNGQRVGLSGPELQLRPPIPRSMAVHRPFRTVFKLDGEPETKVNESVTFNYGVQAEQDPTCHVDFGDGTRQEVSCNKRKIIEGQFSQTISHSYEEPGTYDVRLTVDAGSRTRETTKQVEVHDIFGGQTLVVQTTRSDIEYSVRLLWGNIKGVIGTIEGIDLGYPGLSDRTTSRFVIDEATSERGADGYEFNGMIQEIRAEDPSSITVLVSGNRRPDLVTQMPDCDFQSRIVQFADEDGDCTIEEEELERAEQLMLQDEYTAEQYRSIRQAAE